MSYNRSSDGMDREPASAGPWLTIWASPRETVRRVTVEAPGQWLWAFVVAGGLHRVMTRLPNLPFPDPIPPNRLAAMVLISGPIVGALLIFGLGRLLHALLVRLGGTGSWIASRTAIAWSMAPAVPGLLLWAVMLATYGPDVLSPRALEQAADSTQHFVLGLDYLIEFGLMVWTLGMEVFCLADVHRLSLWRVLAGELVCGLVVLGLAVGVLVAMS